MKKWSISVLAVSLCVLSLVVPVSGAETDQIEIRAAPYVGNIYVEGENVACLGETDTPLPFLSYHGAVYVSLRTAGQWMGAAVLWDEERSSVTMTTGQQEPAYPAMGDYPSDMPWEDGADAMLHPEMTVFLDGEEIQFTDSREEALYPITFQGTLYLPVRGVGGLLNKLVLWQGMADGTSNIYIYDTPTAKQNQDATVYYIDVWSAAQRLGDMLTDLENDKSLLRLDLRDAALREKLSELEGLALSVQELSPPVSNPFCPPHMVDDINRNISYLADVDLARYIDPDAYMPPDYAALDWGWHKEHFFRSLWADYQFLNQAVKNLSEHIWAVGQLGWKPY